MRDLDIDTQGAKMEEKVVEQGGIDGGRKGEWLAGWLAGLLVEVGELSGDVWG